MHGLPGEPTTAELLREGFRWFVEGIETGDVEAGEPVLNPGASMMLSYLDDEPVSPSTVARRMQVSRQRVQVVARELVAAEMIRVKPNPRTARNKLIHITSAGQRRRLRVIEALRSLDQRAERAIGRDDLGRLRALLLRLTAVPRTDPAAPITRFNPSIGPF